LISRFFISQKIDTKGNVQTSNKSLIFPRKVYFFMRYQQRVNTTTIIVECIAISYTDYCHLSLNLNTSHFFPSPLPLPKDRSYNETDRYKTNYTNLVKRIALALKNRASTVTCSLMYVIRAAMIVMSRCWWDTLVTRSATLIFSLLSLLCLPHSHLIDLFYI
jgi:hypothetical protein